MARIGSDRMTIRIDTRSDNTWLLTVCYTACFGHSDLGKRFDDTVVVQDLCGSAGWTAPGVTFTATSIRVLRKKRIVLRSNAVEHVVVGVRLQGADGGALVERRAPVSVPVSRRAIA
jgi:hypothetical protein